MGNNPIYRVDPDGGRDWGRWWQARKNAKANANYVPTGNVIPAVTVTAQSQTGWANFFNGNFDRRAINYLNNNLSMENELSANVTIGAQAGFKITEGLKAKINFANAEIFNVSAKQNQNNEWSGNLELFDTHEDGYNMSMEYGLASGGGGGYQENWNTLNPHGTVSKSGNASGGPVSYKLIVNSDGSKTSQLQLKFNLEAALIVGGEVSFSSTISLNH